MKYVHFDAPGSPDMLNLLQGKRPDCGYDDVQIKVSHAGVNRADLLQRQGRYPVPPSDSSVLGVEVSGNISALGHNAAKFCIGQKVVALTNGGGYAQYVNVPQTQVLELPDNLSLLEGACLAENVFTAWFFLVERAQLHPDEWVLIHGGAGPLGTMAIQIAKMIDAKPIATAGGPERVSFCQQLGADTIDYRAQNFITEIMKITGGHGADVILDPVAGEFIQQNFAAAARNARIAQVAFLGGAKVDLNMAPLLTKQLTYFGNTLRPQSRQAKAKIAHQLRQHIWPKIAKQGLIFPPIHVYDLADAARAHLDLEQGDIKGKFVLACGGA